MQCVAIVLVVISGYLLLDFPHVYHAKTLEFLQLSRQKTSQLTLNLNKKHMVCAALSQKCYQKTRTTNIGKRKHRNVVLLTTTSQNTGLSCCRPQSLPNIKRHSPRGGRRTCYLLVVVVVVIVLLVLRSASATAIASISTSTSIGTAISTRTSTSTSTSTSSSSCLLNNGPCPRTSKTRSRLSLGPLH